MNSNKRDIYFEGRIYKDVDEGPMPSLLFYTSYLVQDSHSFKDGEDVTGAYKLQHQYFGIGHTAVTNEWRDCSENYYDTEFHEDRRIVAIPLPTPAPVDNPDHIFNPVAELPKDNPTSPKEVISADSVEQMAEALNDLIYTAIFFWDNFKPIKDSDAQTVTHPVIEKAKSALSGYTASQLHPVSKSEGEGCTNHGAFTFSGDNGNIFCSECGNKIGNEPVGGIKIFRNGVEITELCDIKDTIVTIPTKAEISL